MSGDHFLGIFGDFALLAIAFTVFEITRKLDRIIRLLESADQQRRT